MFEDRTNEFLKGNIDTLSMETAIALVIANIILEWVLF